MHRYRKRSCKSERLCMIYSSCIITTKRLEFYIKVKRLAVFSFVLDLVDECYSYFWVNLVITASSLNNVHFLDVLIDTFGFPLDKFELCFNSSYFVGSKDTVNRILKEAKSITHLMGTQRFLRSEHDNSLMARWARCAVEKRCQELEPAYIPHYFDDNKRARIH